MNEKLKEILENSTFEVIEGIYKYAKVAEHPKPEKHFAVVKDSDEITVVTKKENLKDLSIIESNEKDYCLIALNVSIPFYSVGFLAAVSSTIASAGMNILIISTYSKDYVLTKHEDQSKAITALTKLGLKKL